MGKVKGNCYVCGKPATNKLFKTDEKGDKAWIPVCDYCDRVIGAENTKRAGGRLK